MEGVVVKSVMDRMVQHYVRKQNRAKRRAARDAAAAAEHKAFKIEENRKLALQFIEWTQRASLKPKRLPRIGTWRNRERLEGWIVSTHWYRGKVLSYIAITTDARIVEVLERTSVRDYLLETESSVAKFIAQNRPDISWPSTQRR